ncbi:TetR/AcrR family transcriptional regulator [Mycobacterium sp. NPDC050853]|uniref:TetR/AcrR family transcriptional regulator n=1 Tax=Mycobacteriaceae TaxID=1762 RepID=UPI0015E04018|nr:TetR/AcrR family transcriptional regulator [Mycobacteroides sp. LB1]
MTRPGAPLGKLMARAVRGLGSHPEPDDIEARLLDASIAVLAEQGTQSATIDEVARRAKVGRATVFRRFSSKDQLFERALGREMYRFLSEVQQRAENFDDVADRVAETFAVCIEITGHPLLRNASARGRASFIDAIGQGSPSPKDLARGYFVSKIDELRAEGRIPPGDSERQADVLIHIVLGYLVSPESPVDLANPIEVRALARETFSPILLAPNEPKVG